MKNIIFLIDAQKGASGGGKVIYQYSNYINSFKGYSSSIAHVKKKKIGKIFDSINKKFNRKFKQVEYSGWNFKDLKIKKNHFFSWFNINIKRFFVKIRTPLGACWEVLGFGILNTSVHRRCYF